LTSKVLCIINSLSGANSGLLVLSWSAETSKRKCWEKNTSVVEKQLLVPPSCQRASSWIATDSRIFWLTRTQLCFLNHPTHMTWLLQTFSYFWNWNPLWKDDDFRRFKILLKIHRQSYMWSRERCTRTVSRSGSDIGSGVSIQEGSNLKGIRLTELEGCPKIL
jgi:hypothetical protein